MVSSWPVGTVFLGFNTVALLFFDLTTNNLVYSQYESQEKTLGGGRPSIIGCSWQRVSPRRYEMALRKHAVQDRGTTITSRLGEPQTGEDFGDEGGTGRKGFGGIGRKAAGSGLGIFRRPKTDPFRGPWERSALKNLPGQTSHRNLAEKTQRGWMPFF